MVALEKKKDKLEALGEITTEHPGYLIAQDTYYVGTIKGVGKIYQQTVIDTYSRVAEAKLYTDKTPIYWRRCAQRSCYTFLRRSII